MALRLSTGKYARNYRIPHIVIFLIFIILLFLFLRSSSPAETLYMSIKKNPYVLEDFPPTIHYKRRENVFINRGLRNVAIMISGQLPRFITHMHLQKYLIDPNPEVNFEIFIDLTNSSYHFWNFSSTTFNTKITTTSDLQNIFNTLPIRNLIIRPQPEIGIQTIMNRLEQSNVYYSGVQQAVTRYRLGNSILSFERKSGLKYDTIFWMREDQLFYDKMEFVGFGHSNSVYCKFCTKFGGINEKTFIFSRDVLEKFTDYVDIFFEIKKSNYDFSCVNDEKCSKRYFKKNNIFIKQIDPTRFPFCDARITKDTENIPEVTKNEACYVKLYCSFCVDPHMKGSLKFCKKKKY